MSLVNTLGSLIDYIGLSIDVVLGLALGNSFDASIRLFLCYLDDLSYGTLIGMLMGPLLSNYMGRYLEAFLVFPLYIYLFRLYKPFLTVSLDTISSSWLWTSHLGQKARYPDLVESPLQSTLAVPNLVYCPKFPTTPSGSCLTSPLQVTLADTLSGG